MPRLAPFGYAGQGLWASLPDVRCYAHRRTRVAYEHSAESNEFVFLAYWLRIANLTIVISVANYEAQFEL
jgi:hypothetical protein